MTARASRARSPAGPARRIVASTIATAIAIILVTALLPQYFHYSGGVVDLVLLALIFGSVNALIAPVLRFLTLPIRVVTLGLAGIAVNAALLLLVAALADRFGIAFQVGKYPPTILAVDTLVAAVVGSVVLGLVNDVTHFVVRD